MKHSKNHELILKHVQMKEISPHSKQVYIYEYSTLAPNCVLHVNKVMLQVLKWLTLIGQSNRARMNSAYQFSWLCSNQHLIKTTKQWKLMLPYNVNLSKPLRKMSESVHLIHMFPNRYNNKTAYNKVCLYKSLFTLWKVVLNINLGCTMISTEIYMETDWNETYAIEFNIEIQLLFSEVLKKKVLLSTFLLKKCQIYK